MKNKLNRPDPEEMERLLKELEGKGVKPEQPLLDSEYLNPWNLGKKKIRGKTSIGAKLPSKLPEL